MDPPIHTLTMAADSYDENGNEMFDDEEEEEEEEEEGGEVELEVRNHMFKNWDP